MDQILVVVSALKADRVRPRQKPRPCRATQRRKNTNAWITGREAHQNAGTNANATLIYSWKQADPEKHTHVPYGNAQRAQTLPRKRRL